jgi:hypothetical protein
MTSKSDSNHDRASLLDGKWPLYSLLLPLLHLCALMAPDRSWRTMIDSVAIFCGLLFIAITVLILIFEDRG